MTVIVGLTRLFQIGEFIFHRPTAVKIPMTFSLASVSPRCVHLYLFMSGMFLPRSDLIWYY